MFVFDIVWCACFLGSLRFSGGFDVSHRRLEDLKQKKRRKDLQETVWRFGELGDHWPMVFLDCHMLHLESFFIWGSVWDVWVRTCQNSGFPSAHWSISTLRHKAAGDPGNLSNSQCPTVLSPAKPFEHHGMPQNVTSITSRITQVV